MYMIVFGVYIAACNCVLDWMFMCVCVYWSEISDLKKYENAILFVSVNIPFSHSKFFEMKLLVCRDREGD